ncbi:hypothetical protein Oter_0255 [Opitutus terrae PB90-1]|uniref:Uncharacterized protein n=1 Tax=Opitutus terrae (strain DSM 11246 / JCM 15787 / PB90-1) TaxID=452637 RepID=B1ZPE0_OPITP|nr:hypothetical protein Oter_0255 [Opitutus terrae PB90-1]
MLVENLRSNSFRLHEWNAAVIHLGSSGRIRGARVFNLQRWISEFRPDESGHLRLLFGRQFSDQFNDPRGIHLSPA